MNVNLSTGTASDGDGGTDTLTSIEHVRGSAFADTITGDSGNNRIAGLEGDDTLVGGDGRDTLRYSRDANYGGTAGVVVNLATGTATDGFGDTDTISGFEEVIGTDSADTLTGDGQDNVLEGLDGDDTINGGGGYDEIAGGAGNDTIDGGDDDDFIRGGTGDDSIDGGAGYDVVVYTEAGSGVTVNLSTGTADDGDGGTDTLSNVEHVRGSAFSDTITGDAADNHINGLEGDDTLAGGDGWDTLRYDRDERYGGGSGVTVNLSTGTATDGFGDTDTLSGFEAVIGTDFADALTGDGHDNYFEGRDGDDTIIGGGGRDNINAGSGNDVIDSSGGSSESQGFGDVIQAGLGSDTITGHAAAFADRSGGGIDLIYEELSGIGGITLTVSGTTGSGTVTGTGVNDTFTYADHFEGTQDADTLIGSDYGSGPNNANESWVGEAGDDLIDGNGGWDTVDYNLEDGGAGVIVNLATGTATDTFGDTDTLQDIEAVNGTGQSDTLTGDAENNYLNGHGDNDTISGGDGDDEIIGGDGDDTIDGGNGRDKIFAGAGDDIIDASGGTSESQGFGDIIQAGLGSDTITGHAAAFADRAGGGLDLIYEELSGIGGITLTVSGSSGSGTVTGTGINDTFTYADHFEGTQDADTLIGSDFGSGPNNASESWVGEGGDDLIDGNGGWDSVAYYLENGGAGVSVDLSTGTATDTFGDTDTLVDIEAVHGTDLSDTLIGDDQDNYLDGRGGDDTLEGGDGNDEMYGGDGSDELHGDDGQDTLEGNDGNDFLYGGAEVDILGGGSGADRLEGGAGNDTLNGGADNDWLIGGEGDDTLNGGDGWDRVDYGTSTAAVTVNLATGTADDGMSGTDTLTSIERVIGSDFNDVLTGDSGDNSFSGELGDDTIDGGDGEDFVWYGRAASAVSVDLSTGVVTGGEGNDTLSNIESIGGSNFSDTLSGDDGDNWFIPDQEGDEFTPNYTVGGSDVIDGRGGNDGVSYWNAVAAVSVNLGTGTATDGHGNTDTLTSIENIEGSSFGDVLTGNSDANEVWGLGGDDTIDTGAGDDEIYGAEGNDTIDGGADTDTLNYESTTLGVTVTLYAGTASGSEIGSDTVSNIENVKGGSGADVITGNGSANLIEGFGGDDTLNANGGSGNVLRGGLGNDTLIGGFGNDQLQGNSGADSFVGGTGADDFYIDALDVSFDGGGGYDRIIVADTNGVNVALAGTNIERVIGGSGNDTFDGTGVTTSLVISGLGGDDILTGGSVTDQISGGDDDDTLDGGDGDDFLFGDAGSDTFIGGKGDDQFFADSGDASFDGGEGYDRVFILDTGNFTFSLAGTDVERVNGNDGNDVLDATGVTSNVTLAGGGGADTLTGGDGNDVVAGQDGADIIEGGAGTDSLFGGAGADTFVFNAGSGFDYLVGWEDGTDMIDFSGYAEVDEFSDLTIIDNGGMTRIEFDGNTVLVLGSTGEIEASDFIFV
ncbi:MAG: hypothetical protein MRY80_01005 [Oricola sp.]|nr:hypothetical protein [Oricola sp.]